MSAVVRAEEAAEVGRPTGASRSYPPDTLRFRTYAWAVISVTAVALAVSWFSPWAGTGPRPLEALIWMFAVAICDLFPVTLWGEVNVTMSFPLLLAAAMVFPPFTAGMIALVGEFDVREVRRGISFTKTLFNRSQVCLATLTTSWIFHSVFGGDARELPLVLLATTALLCVALALNTILVATGASLQFGVSVPEAVDMMCGGSPQRVLFSYLLLGQAAPVLAFVHLNAGAWALLACVAPIALGRQFFAQGKDLKEATRSAEERATLIQAISERISDERKDERLLVAASLHDDVLPPLFTIGVMSDLVRQDLATGDLAKLAEDVHTLKVAASTSSDAIRVIVRGLRESPLGADGLASALRVLLEEIRPRADADIWTRIDYKGGAGPTVELLIYQVAREVLRNCARHSGARNIHLVLEESGPATLELRIADDGCGFDPLAVDATGHFGLRLVEERVALAGGSTSLISQPGFGTTVSATFPRENEAD
jgi:signal transduction histidine kinase